MKIRKRHGGKNGKGGRGRKSSTKAWMKTRWKGKKKLSSRDKPRKGKEGEAC